MSKVNNGNTDPVKGFPITLVMSVVLIVIGVVILLLVSWLDLSQYHLPWTWLIIIFVVIALGVSLYIFRDRYTVRSLGTKTIWKGVVGLLCIGLLLFIISVWGTFIVKNTMGFFDNDNDRVPAEQTSSTPPYDAFAGMETMDFGPIHIRDGQSFRVQVLNGQAYWPHPKRAGTHIATLTDMRGTTVCKTKIVKIAGKDTEFITLVPPPADVVIESYKLTFDRGGDFIVSPEMKL